MSEPDNIILHHLQGICADMQEMRSEIRTVQSEMHEIHRRFGTVETQISGITQLMTLLPAHYHSLDERVDILEQRS